MSRWIKIIIHKYFEKNANVFFWKNKANKFINNELESDYSDKPEYLVGSDKQSVLRLADESTNQLKSGCISKQIKVL